LRSKVQEGSATSYLRRYLRITFVRTFVRRYILNKNRPAFNFRKSDDLLIYENEHAPVPTLGGITWHFVTPVNFYSMCFAENLVFLLDLARSVAPQRRAFPRRAAQRRVKYTWYVHVVSNEPTCRKSVPARANRRRTRTRIALLTVHNSSSRFLCPWPRACSASPCLPR